MTNDIQTNEQPAKSSKIGQQFAVLAIIISLLIGGIPGQLFLGWLLFPLRVFPKMIFDWWAVGVGAMGLVAFACGVHVSARWFVRAISTAAPGQVHRVWSLRATRSVAVILLLMFVSGTAIVGVMHQIVWILTDRESRPDDLEAHAQRYPSLLAMVQSAREAANQTQFKFRLRDTSGAIESYKMSNGSWPYGGTMSADGELLHGWAVFLSGYSYYVAPDIDFTRPWNQPPNDHIYRCGFDLFINPSLDGPYFDDQGYGLSHIAGNSRVLRMHRGSDRHLAKPSDEQVLKQDAAAPDGLSNTILLGSVAEQFRPWGHPANLRDPAAGINRSPEGFGGPRSYQGAMFAMCDGSVRMLSQDIDPHVLSALATPDDSTDRLP